MSGGYQLCSTSGIPKVNEHFSQLLVASESVLQVTSTCMELANELQTVTDCA